MLLSNWIKHLYLQLQYYYNTKKHNVLGILNILQSIVKVVINVFNY